MKLSVLRTGIHPCPSAFALADGVIGAKVAASGARPAGVRRRSCNSRAETPFWYPMGRTRAVVTNAIIGGNIAARMPCLAGNLGWTSEADTGISIVEILRRNCRDSKSEC